MVNLASQVSRVECETYPLEVALSNSQGKYKLIKIALKSKVLYVYVSSSQVYWYPNVVLTPETFVGEVSKRCYRQQDDEGKRFGKGLTKAYERKYVLRNIILRLYNIDEPRNRNIDIYVCVIYGFTK